MEDFLLHCFWSLCVKTYLLFCTRYNKVTTRRKRVQLDFYQFRQLLTPIYSTVKASVTVLSGILQLTDSISTKTRHSQTRLQALRQTGRLLVLFAVKSLEACPSSPSNAITCVFHIGVARGGAGLTPLRVRREIQRVHDIWCAGQAMAVKLCDWKATVELTFHIMYIEASHLPILFACI